MELFDTHAHYDDEKFNEDREEILKQIKESGVTKLVSIGYDIQSTKTAIDLAKNYDYIYASAGISPNDLPQTEEELWKMLSEIEKLAQNKKIVAIGEIGLDYYWNKENKELQKLAFIEQIKIANKLDLPIAIHTRDAVSDTIDILKNQITVKNRGIFHCCPQNRELIKEALKLDFYISFAGPITFKNAKNADEMISLVPLEKQLIETDSPYLAPEPNRGKRNDSRNVKYIAQKIADVHGIPVEEVAKITYQNACTIYKIKNLGKF